MFKNTSEMKRCLYEDNLMNHWLHVANLSNHYKITCNFWENIVSCQNFYFYSCILHLLIWQIPPIFAKKSFANGVPELSESTSFWTLPWVASGFPSLSCPAGRVFLEVMSSVPLLSYPVPTWPQCLYQITGDTFYTKAA